MAIYRIQRPPQISSSWTTEKFVKMIRSLLDELDNSRLLDQEIRYYTNLAVSAIASTTTEISNAGYYGVLMQGQLDNTGPLMTIDLDVPLWDNDYDQAPKPNSISSVDYTPAREVNPHVMPMDSTLASANTIDSPNIFNEPIQEIPTIPPAQPLARNRYSEYYSVSGVIESVIDVSVTSIKSIFPNSDIATFNLPDDFFAALTKLSYSELSYLRSHSYTFNQHGAWTFFGSKVYVLLGRDLLNLVTGIVDEKLTANMEAFSFDIAGMRKPILDNLADAWNKDSGWWSHIDLPDKHMRLLAVSVQKMCLDKLGKRFGPDHENILNQLFGVASQMGQANNMAMQADRMKQEQGFQTR